MIVFRCPICDVLLEIKDHMAGKEVDCIECGETIEVPLCTPQRYRGRLEGLSPTEWTLYTLLFVFVPCVNVILSSVLYYTWRNSQPRRATQINLLGFVVFGFHIFLRVFFWALFKA
jgi:hypothetical protein